MSKKKASYSVPPSNNGDALPSHLSMALRTTEWNLLRLCRILRHGTLWNLMVDSRGPVALSPLLGAGNWERFPIHHKVDLSANATVAALITHHNDLMNLDDVDARSESITLREAAVLLYLRRISPAVAYQCSIRNGEIHFIEFRLSYLFNSAGSLDLYGEEFERFLERIPTIPE